MFDSVTSLSWSDICCSLSVFAVAHTDRDHMISAVHPAKTLGCMTQIPNSSGCFSCGWQLTPDDAVDPMAASVAQGRH
jgi:hypothetical protein